jgi:taurine transport system substrate-binding protein
MLDIRYSRRMMNLPADRYVRLCSTRWLAIVLAMIVTACGSQPASKEGGAAGGATASGAARPARLRIGYQAIPNAELVAKQLKWHEQTLGIPIEWRQFESGRDVNTAIAAGSIDLGLSGSGGAATALAQGLPLSVIAIHDVIGRSEALAVRASIRSVTDLRGKRLAAPFASTTHYSLLKLLELHKIGPGEVTLLDLNPSDMTAAWIRGDIDAAYIWQPTLQRLLDAGGTRLTSSDEMAARGVATFDVAVASHALMATYPDVIVSYLKTLSRAVTLYRTDQQQALDALARELGVPVDQARLQADGLVWLTAEEQLDAKYFGAADAPGGLASALKATADFLVAQKVIRTAPELATFQQRTDGQFLRRASSSAPSGAAAGGAAAKE